MFTDNLRNEKLWRWQGIQQYLIAIHSNCHVISNNKYQNVIMSTWIRKYAGVPTHAVKAHGGAEA
jgi:hypothetical protein